MTPVAAYFIFTADEQQRAQRAHDIHTRGQRRSVLDRFRALAAALRPRPVTIRPA